MFLISKFIWGSILIDPVKAINCSVSNIVFKVILFIPLLPISFILCCVLTPITFIFDLIVMLIRAITGKY